MSDKLVDMLNREVIPVVYEQGSLGVSGDRALDALQAKEGLALINNGTQAMLSAGP